MVVVSHLFFFLRKYFRGRCDSGESHRPLSGTIYFPTAPFPIPKPCIDYGLLFVYTKNRYNVMSAGPTAGHESNQVRGYRHEG